MLVITRAEFMHPSKAMDLSSASQLISNIWLANHGRELKPAVYEFPSELDTETAFAKLETMGISIDKWTNLRFPKLGHSWVFHCVG
jgi:S-adenosylhomocysteine hydrolase